MSSLTSKVALPAVAAKDVAPKGGDRVRDDRAWSVAGPKVAGPKVAGQKVVDQKVVDQKVVDQKVVDLVRAAAKVPIVELPNSNGESPN
jgi:hypothetical protein